MAAGNSFFDFPSAPGLSGGDLFLVLANTGGSACTKSINATSLFGNVAQPTTFKANVAVANTLYLSSNNLLILDNHTPSSSSETLPGRKFWFDDNYLYVTISNNNIKRVALSSF